MSCDACLNAAKVGNDMEAVETLVPDRRGLKQTCESGARLHAAGTVNNTYKHNL